MSTTTTDGTTREEEDHVDEVEDVQMGTNNTQDGQTCAWMEGEEDEGRARGLTW